MKSLKLKKKTQKKKDTTKDIRSIQQLIFEDVKNINKFNIIIEEFILSLQNNDKNIDELYNLIREIVEYFLVKNKDMITADLSNFIDEKINILIKVFIDVLDDDTPELNSQILGYIIENLSFIQDENTISNYIQEIIKIFIINEDIIDPQNISNFTKVFIENEGYFLKVFKSLYESSKSMNNLEKNTIYNIYNFIISISSLNLENEDIEKETKVYYQNILIFIINNTAFPYELLKNLLLNLNKFIFDNLDNPLIFSDYLISIYEKSEAYDFDVKILSLSGLFVLITKYKLDYATYYKILYRSISLVQYDAYQMKMVFDSKYRSRIFKIIELSLKQSSVPILIILAFVKKLARICLTTSSNNIVIILGIIQNLIKAHPKSLILLIRKRKKQYVANSLKDASQFTSKKDIVREENKDEEAEKEQDELFNAIDYDEEISNMAKYEQFDNNELDPYICKAQYSGLWELYTLKNHFSFKIRSIVYKFEHNFMKTKEFQMDTVANIKDEDLLYDLKEGANFYVSHDTDRITEKINTII